MLTYERIARYLPQPVRKRPVVLVGPSNVGRHELRVKLIESELDRFAAPVPHTSRQPQPGEQDGVDFHFVSKFHFEELAEQGAFVEYGLYQRAWYGTSKDAIREIINSGKVCILTMQPGVSGSLGVGCLCFSVGMIYCIDCILFSIVYLILVCILEFHNVLCFTWITWS